jgi:hypothetical protein
MKRSGSKLIDKERLHGNATIAQQEDLRSTPFFLALTLPLLQDQEVTKEKEASEDIDLWVKNAMRLGSSSTGEAGKSTGSPKAPAGFSFSSSSAPCTRQATARQVAAELIRRGDLSLYFCSFAQHIKSS